MKKYRTCILLALVVVIALGGYLYLTAKNITSYIIDAQLDTHVMALTGRETVKYVNTEDVPLKEIYFHLYPNAFKDETIAPFPPEEMGRAYPDGFSPGYIDILSVKVGEEDIQFDVDNTIMKVTLPHELTPGKTADITINFVVKLPPSDGRFGYGKYTVRLANWYPVVSVYDSDGWNLDPYYAIGDPFYSDVANYTVRLVAPAEYIMASTGTARGEENQGNRLWFIKANNVRDMAIVLSDRFKVKSGEYKGIKVNSFYFGDDKIGERSLKYAADAVKYFSETFGKYPYSEYDVVAADFYIGGMEYPQLVMIDRSLYNKNNIFVLEEVIAHETAHQWWYGAVGNDEVEEPWLDEALTEFSTVMYFENYYGNEVAERFWKAYDGFVKKYADSPRSITDPVNEFKDGDEYGAVVYEKGALSLKRIRDEIGKEAFIKGLREYYKTYKFKNATVEDLIKALSKAADKDMSTYFKKGIGILNNLNLFQPDVIAIKGIYPEIAKYPGTNPFRICIHELL
ncbi:MAG: M1 family metallopeptidase [Thermoanaerobacteraceae bacterium]|nr:M1 family metallopeptidase [Thermoanaerobacteraceae bacterium]